MDEVRCPRCKEEMQFPFMICPDCRWKVKGRNVLKYSEFGHIYIKEHPQDRHQLERVLSLSLEDRTEEAELLARRKKSKSIMDQIIKPWVILFSFFLGLFGMVLLTTFLIINRDFVNNHPARVLVIVDYLWFLFLFGGGLAGFIFQWDDISARIRSGR